jgi:membrane glycosyltransferase
VPWLVPVLLGLSLSIPFARVTSSTALGVAARSKGWFVIPEESNPPVELERLDQKLAARENPLFQQPQFAENSGLLQAILDPSIHAVHLSLLRLREQPREQTREYFQELRSKLLLDGPGTLTREERSSLLWDGEALINLHRELWTAPGEGLHAWWQRALRHYNEATEIATRRSLASSGD